jgi:hypothetical protein
MSLTLNPLPTAGEGIGKGEEIGREKFSLPS